MKIKRLYTILITLALAMALSPLTQAGVQESPFDDIDALISQSDVIIRGHVQSIRQSQRSTLVKVGVDTVFKGSPDVSSLVVKHGGGKFVVKTDQPSFQSYDQAILYLVQREDFYECLYGAEGKKTILNNNVYLHPDNSFVSMHVDKYVEKLNDRLASLYPEPEQI